MMELLLHLKKILVNFNKFFLTRQIMISKSFIYLDFKSIKKRHHLKPNLMNKKTDLFPVYMPDTVVIETKEKIENFQFNKEILELYFSNKKRSGGENVREISFNSKHHKIAYVSFKDFESKRIT
jgi:hypothetical protein